MLKKTKRKGFTLVELLVVIAIIAILATASVVGYVGLTKKAYRSNAISDLSGLRTGILAELSGGSKVDSDNKVTYSLTSDAIIKVSANDENEIAINGEKFLSAFESVGNLTGTITFNEDRATEITLNSTKTSDTISKIYYSINDGEGLAVWDLSSDTVKAVD